MGAIGQSRHGSVHWGAQGTPYHASSAIIAAAFSPIIIVGACVQAFSAAGMIEASATRNPCNPITRKRGSTTALGIVKLSRFGRDKVQRARLHATAVALRHCAAASDRKIRRVERETRCR